MIKLFVRYYDLILIYLNIGLNNALIGAIYDQHTTV